MVLNRQYYAAQKITKREAKNSIAGKEIADKSCLPANTFRA